MSASANAAADRWERMRLIVLPFDAERPERPSLKDEIYHLVNSLDEERAEEALRLLRLLVDEEAEQLFVTSRRNLEDLEAIAASSAFGFDDPLWNIVGIIEDEGPTDVSENKYHYLAEAYADRQTE
jgi:hypothetical protein